jgi:RHS repeat-associated protein
MSGWQNAASSPNATDAFLYDNQGHRVAQQAVQNGSTITTVYVGNLEQVVSSGGTASTQTFYYANGLRLAMAVNGSFYYLASDALGSLNVAVRASDQSQSTALFDPYGRLRYSGGTMPTDLGFGGMHTDSVTGLDYFNARYYDPISGQFASPDRILPGGGLDVLGLSRYAYVEGNPETLTDPSGMCVTSSPEGCGLGNSGEPNDTGLPPPPAPPSPVGTTNAQIDLGESPSVPVAALNQLNHLANPSALAEYRELVAYEQWEVFKFGQGAGAEEALLAFLALMAGGTDRLSVEFHGSGSALASALLSEAGAYRSGLTSLLAAEGGNDFISVFHGSINDSSAILKGGLDSSRGATFVSRDVEAARDAIGPNNVQFPGRDPGIIESRIPRSDFERVLATNERPYQGFFPYELDSSEIVLREQEAFDLFNRYIVR